MSQDADHPAVRHAAAAIRAGKFNRDIEAVILSTIRSGPDDGLRPIGFVLKMAVHLIDCCGRPMGLREAKRMARSAYNQFLSDAGNVKFGDPDFDWSGRGARELAHEYEVDYWEPTNG